MRPRPNLADSDHRIPSLDGIRAVSFLVVFGSHVYGGSRVPGDFGVTVFFFLSGYLITTLMRMELENTGTLDIRNFYLRRALRILPPLYASVLIAVLMAWLFYPPGTIYGPGAVADLLFYANYSMIFDSHSVTPGTGVIWSLAVEEHFYLLFPFLFVAMQKLRISAQAQASLLWGFCALILAWRYVLVLGWHVKSDRIFFATDTRIDSILFGCALAVWNNPFLDPPLRLPKLLKYVLLPLALLVLRQCAYSSGTVFTDTACFSVEGAALTIVFICAIRFHASPGFLILNYRPIVFVGVLSYSLYLVHHTYLQAIRQSAYFHHAWQQAIVALGASLITAWAIHVFIENPATRRRKERA